MANQGGATSESYAQRVENDFEASLQSKMRRVD